MQPQRRPQEAWPAACTGLRPRVVSRGPLRVPTEPPRFGSAGQQMNDLVQLLLCRHSATQGPEDGHSWAAADPRQTCSVACGPSRQEAAPAPFCLSSLLLLTTPHNPGRSWPDGMGQVCEGESGRPGPGAGGRRTVALELPGSLPVPLLSSSLRLTFLGSFDILLHLQKTCQSSTRSYSVLFT